jgi:hypothetical protein
MTWPELVPAFKAAIQNSILVNPAGNAELRTLNVLIGVQTITKPFQVTRLLQMNSSDYGSISIFLFWHWVWRGRWAGLQYFLNPTVAHEPVPEQLELIAKELLAPLHGIFHHLVQQVSL